MKCLVLLVSMLCATSRAMYEDAWLNAQCGKHITLEKWGGGGHTATPVCVLTNVGRKAVNYPGVDEYSVMDIRDGM